MKTILYVRSDQFATNILADLITLTLPTALTQAKVSSGIFNGNVGVLETFGNYCGPKFGVRLGSVNSTKGVGPSFNDHEYRMQIDVD